MPGTARFRALVMAVFTAALLVTALPATPAGSTAAAASPSDGAKSEAQQVIDVATAKVGSRYAWGTSGPRTFDCSGLVIFAYRKAGLADVVGDGKYRSASALYRWFKSRGLASRSNPLPGDIVVWGGGRHVGIYIGNGKTVSALTQGVRVHTVHAVIDPFTAYLHTGLSTDVPEFRRATVSLNLRTGPSTARDVVRVLRPRALLSVIGSRKDALGRTWLRVSNSGDLGWVAGWLTAKP